MKKIIATVALAAAALFGGMHAESFAQSQTVVIDNHSMPGSRRLTVKQFLKLSDSDTTSYIIKGVVKSVRNAISGNLYLKDKTGKILVYGIHDITGGHDGLGKELRFPQMEVLKGDTLVLQGRRHVFNGTVIEMKDAAVLHHGKGPKHDKIMAKMQAERNPRFKGGDRNTFIAWVQNHLKYPADAKAAGQSGTVMVSFAVGRNGKVQEVLVSESVCPALDAEAVRVVSMSPKWKPAKRNGQPVRTPMTIPVTFALPE